MTTVFCDDSAEPRMHALVAGVSAYRYLKGGDPPSTEWPWRDLGQLTCPSKSAEAVGRWLLTNQICDPVKPLGSLEMTCSPSLQLVTGHDGEPGINVDVEAATFDHFQESMDRWFSRCDGNEENIGFFYFSGHGIQTDTLALLLDDAGKDRKRFFEGAFDFDVFYDGMERCNARIQCYFVDACRLHPLAERWSKVRPRTLIEAGLRSPYRDAPKIFSTEEGLPAYGTPGQCTEFTKAILDALDRCGAEKSPDDDAWRVTTESIGKAIRQLLQRGSRAPARFSCGGGARGGAIRTLPGAPIVPFRLGFLPEEAQAVAGMKLVEGMSRRIAASRKTRECRVWESEISADKYDFEATFADGRFRKCEKPIWVMPPYVDRYYLAEHA
jgi:Caspase domain